MINSKLVKHASVYNILYVSWMLFWCLNLPQQINRYSAVKSKLDNLDVWVFCYKKGLKMIKKKHACDKSNQVDIGCWFHFTNMVNWQIDWRPLKLCKLWPWIQGISFMVVV